MLLPSKRARTWLFVAGALLLALAASLAVALRGLEPLGGGTPLGRLYGVVTAALILLLFALPLRRRAFRSKLGTIDGWIQAHLYLGLVALAFAVAHAGGRCRDPLAVAALVVLVAVVATGIVGARLYATIPARLTRIEGELGPELLAEAIEGQRQVVRRLAAGRSSAFQEVVRHLEARLRPGRLAGWRLLVAGPRPDDEPPPALLAAVGPAEQGALAALRQEGRRAIELQRSLERTLRLRNLLEVWRWLHLPLATVLLVLVIAHTLAASYFSG